MGRPVPHRYLNHTRAELNFLMREGSRDRLRPVPSELVFQVCDDYYVVQPIHMPYR